MRCGQCAGIEQEFNEAVARKESARYRRRGPTGTTRILIECWMAPTPPPITLDRVICCYHDMPSLVGLSAARARRRYGIVIPRATWWNALGIALLNAVMRLRRSAFRSFLHPPAEIETIIRGYGFRRQYLRDTVVWRVAVYGR